MSDGRAQESAEAAEALLRRAAELAKSLLEEDPDASFEFGERWEPDPVSPGIISFRLAPIKMGARELASSTAQGQIQQSEEWRDFEEALKVDEVFAPHVDSMVWSGGSGSPLSVEEVARNLLHVALRDNDWDAISDAAGEIWADFVTFTFREREVLRIVAPLNNFTGPDEEISLGAGIVVGISSDEDIARSIFAGVVTSPFSMPSRSMWVTSRWSISANYEAERLLLSSGESPSPEALQASREQVVARVERVVHSLILFKPDTVSAASAALFSGEAHLATSEWIQRLPLSTGGSRGGDAYVLRAEEVEEFVRFHDSLTQGRAAHRPLDTAVRRFADAAGRTRSDDQLTDLIIAIEALILGDSDRELSFRVALRVAAFVDMEEASRIDMFEFLKRAYNVRSSIVHGNSPKRKDLKNIAGEGVTLQAFADETEEVVRRVLRQVTATVEETGEFKVDWETRLLGDE